MRENLRLIKEELIQRSRKIEQYGYNSKERILTDEELKVYFEETESNFQDIKREAFRNKYKLSPVEVDSRGKELNLLKKNLNILSKQFNAARRPSIVKNKKANLEKYYKIPGIDQLQIL
jgi:hypothetical protein